jgi:hypothetical protein
MVAMPEPRPTVTIFQTAGGAPSPTGAGAFQRRANIAGMILLAGVALVLTLLILIPLALLTVILGAIWLLYVKLAAAFSSLGIGGGRGGRRNVRVIER